MIQENKKKISKTIFFSICIVVGIALIVGYLLKQIQPVVKDVKQQIKEEMKFEIPKSCFPKFEKGLNKNEVPNTNPF